MNTFASEQSVTRAQPFIRKILVAVDLRSDATAEYAAYIAKCLGAWLKLVYVHPSETVYNFISTDGFDFIAVEKGSRRYALRTLTRRMLKRYPFCSQAFLEGNPAEEIALFARKINADLIILGSDHSNFFEGLLHLDQVLQVMRKAHCPVLIFRGLSSAEK